MTLKKIEILGLRGFSERQTLKFGINNDSIGSGMTVIVGPNNSGKSTIFESLVAVTQHNPPSFTEGKRNKKAGDKIEITIYEIDGSFLSLKTVAAGGSETAFHSKGLTGRNVKLFSLPSRRTFEPHFGKGQHDRAAHILNTSISATRGVALHYFPHRLFNIQQSQEQLTNFNKILSRVLDPTPTWYIDQSDGGQYYLKFVYEDHHHNSDGAGEGLLSLMTIIDSLYDSSPGDIIVIDEPELSLHPSLQRRLNKLFAWFAATRQIVIFTHSPYFIDWPSLSNGGTLARTQKNKDGKIEIHQISEQTVKGLTSLTNNFNNPHIIGLEAKEVFFLEDHVLLMEGQEDVVFFRKVCSLLNVKLSGAYYGWGAGGAGNIPLILNMLKDLGFKKICTILDNNMKDKATSWAKDFESFQFLTLPTDDIRDKEAVNKPAIEGLIDSGGKEIKQKFLEPVKDMVTKLDKYFSGA